MVSLWLPISPLLPSCALPGTANREARLTAPQLGLMKLTESTLEGGQWVEFKNPQNVLKLSTFYSCTVAEQKPNYSKAKTMRDRDIYNAG